MELKNGCHLRNTTTWDYPGEPPAARAVVGRVGKVAKPWSPAERAVDPEKEDAAQLLAAWRASQRKTLSLADLPTPKRQRVDAALSPESKAAVNELVAHALRTDPDEE